MNRRHTDFQSVALPTELPRHFQTLSCFKPKRQFLYHWGRQKSTQDIRIEWCGQPFKVFRPYRGSFSLLPIPGVHFAHPGLFTYAPPEQSIHYIPGYSLMFLRSKLSITYLAIHLFPPEQTFHYTPGYSLTGPRADTLTF